MPTWPYNYMSVYTHCLKTTQYIELPPCSNIISENALLAMVQQTSKNVMSTWIKPKCSQHVYNEQLPSTFTGWATIYFNTITDSMTAWGGGGGGGGGGEVCVCVCVCTSSEIPRNSASEMLSTYLQHAATVNICMTVESVRLAEGVLCVHVQMCTKIVGPLGTL